MEIQHPLKKQATWTFYYAYDGILFIIATLVNSKQLRENEKTLILMDFLDKILVLKIKVKYMGMLPS